MNQQDRLSELETLLDSYDSTDAETGHDGLRSRTEDLNQPRPQRQLLLGTVDKELKAYGKRSGWLCNTDADLLRDELILRSSQMIQLDRPQWRNRQGVMTFIWNDGQLCKPDRDYILHVDDLITLGGDKERSWVHGVIEALCTYTAPRICKVSTMSVDLSQADMIEKLFQDTILALKSPEGLGFSFHAKSRFDKVVAFLFTMTMVAGIMVPIFVLYLLRCRSGAEQNAVTLGFTTFFALLCSTCTTAKRHEIFAATAA